jgi:hypothetical protein
MDSVALSKGGFSSPPSVIRSGGPIEDLHWEVDRFMACAIALAALALLGTTTDNADGASTAVGVLIVLALGFLPAIIAFSRRAELRWVVLVLCLFSAFVVTWIIALILALGKTTPKPDPTPSPEAQEKRRQQIEAFFGQDLRPVDAGNMVLREGEKCYYSASAQEAKLVKQVTHVGTYGGPSVRVARGLYWRVGGYGGRSISTQQLQVVDTGTLFLTDQRVVFVGTAGTLEFRSDKMASYQLFDDGIRIDMPNKPFVLFVTGSPEAGWTFERLKHGLIVGRDSLQALSGAEQQEDSLAPEASE